MSKTFEEEMQELEDNMASVTIQDSIHDSEENVSSILNDLLDDIERLEPPSKVEVAAVRTHRREHEVNALLAQIEADMTVVAFANKYESEVAFAECAERVERFVESTKIPVFIQQPPVGLIRSNSTYDVSEDFTTVLPEAVAPSPMAPPKMVRSASQAPSAFCPPTPRKAF
jgi:hypothetical protein